MFFRLNDNATLGREESRSGYFLDRRDYCKLHIIAHYVRALLGPDFTVFPVGKVGADDVGRRLLDEMREGGLTMTYVEQEAGSQTLFSFCFLFPDGSGGNMTTSDSACAHVDPAFVTLATQEFARFAGHGVALAAPEVSIDARAKLLELATAHRFYRVASFTSEEMGTAMRAGLLRSVDLLALNLDEAAAGVRMAAETHAPASIVEATVAAMLALNPAMHLSITQGKEGSWTWDGSSLTRVPAIPVPVESTAGAGDAFVAGLIAGVTAGLSLPQAQQLATLSGAVSVTSPHTINRKLSRSSLMALCASAGRAVDKNVLTLLEAES
jgi:sugar/nucleoside kinase (ribokinase family)